MLPLETFNVALWSGVGGLPRCCGAGSVWDVSRMFGGRIMIILPGAKAIASMLCPTAKEFMKYSSCLFVKYVV